jgi:putative salt-induced outer membrane protein YdiY
MKHLSFLLVLFALILPAKAETITFTNGDRLSGNVVGNTMSGIRFQTNFGQEVFIPYEQIADSAAPQPEQISAVVPAAPAPEEVASIEPAAGPATGVDWSGSVNLGGNLQDGNTQRSAFVLDSEATARRKDDRFKASLDYNVSEEGGTNTEDEITLEGVYDYFFSPEWFANSNLKFQRDKISNIDLRSEFGLGIGHQVYETDPLNLQYILGLSYIREDFTTPTDREENIALSWSYDYDQKFFDDNLTLFHNHGLDVPIDETDAWLFDSETGLKVPVAQKLDGTLQVDYDWDNAPAIGIEEDDITYKATLGYSW